MAAREQLQYSQPSPTDIVLVDPNYIDNVMMDNVICHDNAWTTWGPMTSVSDGSIGSLDSPATKSGLKDERRKSNNRASQRAYRNRKIQHVAELEEDVREIERKSQQLQCENRKFVRELCEIRVNNKDLRSGCNSEKRQQQSSPNHRSRSPSGTRAKSCRMLHANAASEASRYQTLEDLTEGTDSPTESLSGTWDELRSTYADVNDSVLTEAMLETLIELIDSGINLTVSQSHPVQRTVEQRKNKK